MSKAADAGKVNRVKLAEAGEVDGGGLLLLLNGDPPDWGLLLLMCPFRDGV
jgi:hypothetical protein